MSLQFNSCNLNPNCVYKLKSTVSELVRVIRFESDIDANRIGQIAVRAAALHTAAVTLKQQNVSITNS